MDGLHFIYFADPMCSWCYGFAPVVAKMRQRYVGVLPIRLIMGGLRPGATEPMPESARRKLASHWAEIGAVAEVPFDTAAFAEREGFVYDTDPAARAVVLARRNGQDAGLNFLEAAHYAFYGEGRDVTNLDVLADLAADQGFDRDAFRAGLVDEGVVNETWRDYAIAQRAGANGFPTLIVGPNADGTYALVTRGFQSSGTILSAVDTWLSQVETA